MFKDMYGRTIEAGDILYDADEKIAYHVEVYIEDGYSFIAYMKDTEGNKCGFISEILFSGYKIVNR